MSNLKLIALLLVSFVATGSVMYQIRSRRPKQPIVARAPAGSSVLPAQPPPANSQAEGGETPQPAIPAPIDQRTTLPAEGWGRNPFVTLEEISKANPAPVQEAAEKPPEVKVEPTGPPAYLVTAIISGPNGSFAVVNSRVVQAGDRLGTETVKEIKTRAIVLENDGRTRELPLRRIGADFQLTVPKGD
jgi:hypothetical protein